MADQEAADQILPAFWSLSPFPRSRPRSRSDSDHLDHRQFLALSLFDRVDAMDSAGFFGLPPGSRQDPGNDGWGGDEFFIGRRRRTLSGSGSESESTSEFSRARPVDHDGLRICGFEPDDSDSDEQIVAIGHDPIPNDQIQPQEEINRPSFNLNVDPLFWDCLGIADGRRDMSNDNSEEFEWEEIDGRLDEREVIGFSQERYQEEEEEEGTNSNVAWEVLLTNLGSGEDAESFFDEGFVYANSDYDDVTFAQFHEHHDSTLKGSPPAAKSAVESLPSFVLTKEDVEKNDRNISCAVCKDEISAEERAKRLPCSHCYHEECILPWLGVRNTCPLCRYELPTDDPEYESWKARRGGNADAGDLEIVEDERIRYDFEMLAEA